MIGNMHRRDLLRWTAAAGVAAAAAPCGAAPQFQNKIRKAVKYHMIAGTAPVLEKLQLLKDLGYDGVEVRTAERDLDFKELRRASERTGLPVHGVINSASPDIKSAVDLAKYLEGTSVLVVAGRVNKDTSYDDNYTAMQARYREALPYAEQQGIRLLVENVWNNFLLSPLEMRRFIDELESPVIGVYFDVGNVVRYGWPQHWIRILGKRIGKLDIKEFSRAKEANEGVAKGFQVPLGEGDCDWPEVRAELAKLDYQGWATAELPAGDRPYLADVAARMDRVLDLV